MSVVQRSSLKHRPLHLYLYKGKKEKIMQGYCDSRFKGLIAITLFNSNNSLLLRGQLNVAQRSCTVIPNRAVVITGTNLTDKTLLMQLGRIFTIHYLFQTLTADDFICNTRQGPNFCDKANKKDCGSHVWLCPVTRRRPVPAKPSEVSAKTNTAAEI